MISYQIDPKRVLEASLVNLFIRHESRTLQQMIWLWNQPYIPQKKVYFNEFVANALRDMMGMIVFDLWVCEGC